MTQKYEKIRRNGGFAIILYQYPESIFVYIPPSPPNKNLKVDRNLGVLILYFGFKETLCLCDFQNNSCKSVVVCQ